MDAISTFESLEDDRSRMEYLTNMVGTKDISNFHLLCKAKGQELLNLKEYGFTLLHVSAVMNRPKFVSLLLEAGTDINSKEKNGVTPLHAAVTQGNFRVVKVLVEQQANILVKANDGENAVDSAKRADHPEIAEFLEKQLELRNLEDDGKYSGLSIAEMKAKDLLLSDSNSDTDSDSH